jgi:outer membrane lipoprotein-sorting protein
MKRRLLLSLVFGAAVLAFPEVSARADQPAQAATADPDLARIETYLNGLRSLTARFVQVAPNGAIAEGTAWLERPGRMRFQYDPPSPLLLVAGHGLVVFHDASNQQTSNIPIGQTPLGILLADHVNLSGDVRVLSLTHRPGEIDLTVDRAASPGDGNLMLVFQNQPLALLGWLVTDAQRQQTRVTLANVQLGGRFAPSLFEFIDPRLYQNGGGG